MPAIALDTVKLVFSGSRAGGEEWSTGLWMVAAETPDQADLDALAAYAWTQFQTMWGFINGRASAATKPLRTNAYFYAAGDLTSSLVAEAASEVAVGTGTNNHPYQCSLVVSLRSATPGRSTRGRMYLPLDSVGMDAAGQYSAANIGVVAPRVQTFIQALNDYTGLPVRTVVASRTTGTAYAVTRIEVDSIPDIQRRRANQLAATTATALAITA